MHILYPHDLGREEREEEREGGKGREEREKREKEKEQEEYIYNSYRGEDLGYPPQSIFPQKNPFSIDIIWHNYNKIRLFYKNA